jgi:hypothetical protein
MPLIFTALEILWLEDINAQFFDRLEVLHVASTQYEVVLCRCRSYDGVTCPEPVRERILLDVYCGAMPDIFRQRKNVKTEVLKKVLGVIMLLSVLSRLEQLQVSLNREEPFFFAVNRLGSLAISPLDPDKYIRVIEHGVDLP